MNLKEHICYLSYKNYLLFKILKIYFLYISPLFKDIKNFFYYYIIRKSQKDSLIIFGITPTTYCNAKCNFCVYKSFQDTKSCMDIDTFKKAISYISPNTKDIYITPTLWEVFMDKKIFEKLILLKKFWYNINFFTNGTLLWIDNNYKKLVDIWLNKLTISIWDLDYKKEAIIYWISEWLAQKKLEGILKLLIYNDKKKNIKTIHLWFRQMRSPKEITRSSLWKKIFSRKFSFNLEYLFLFGFLNRWGKIKKEEMIWDMKLSHNRIFKRYPCKYLSGANILPNWDVRLCWCQIKNTLSDDLVIGNIHKNSVNEIHNSIKYQDIINNFHKWIYPEVCKKCTLYTTKLD